jgi:hypothetical protein
MDVTLPDLNVWNYYLQGHIKEKVCKYNSYIVKGLQTEICNGILEISKERKSEETAKKLGHNDFKATYGCLDGNASLGNNSRRNTARIMLML